MSADTAAVIMGRPGGGNRPALPPGHPETWGAIIKGTMLAGNVYTPPTPVPGRTKPKPIAEGSAR